MGRGGVEAWTSHSAQETMEIGRSLGSQLLAGTVLALYGDLGAGKTTLMKGLISGATGIAEEEICSPTFVYMQDYPGRPPIVHFDLYRLTSSSQFFALGLDEALGGDAVCCIEWADRIEEILPKERLQLTISHEPDGARRIVLVSNCGDHLPHLSEDVPLEQIQ
jgi:tRNA threonylcarbamoyladenosine biosynthesis protein TsaE